MSKFKFISQKDLIIKLFSEGKTYTEIARLLHCTNINNDASNIRRLVIHTLGSIKGNTKIVMTPEVSQKVLALLKNGNNVPKISKILNISKGTITSYLSHHNIHLNPYKGNVHYFDVIDSYAKAYIVGFIAADGALVKSKKHNTTTLTITLKYEDKSVLEFIKSEIGNTHNLYEIIRPCSYNPNKLIRHMRYAISDMNICTALLKLGITSNKSLTIDNIIQNIPYKYRDAFIIGYFDGDGSVSVNENRYNSRGYLCKDHSLYISFRGTKEFLTGICNHLNITINHIRKYDSIYTLSFASKKDTYRLFQCYNHLPFYYKRKHDKFLQRINHPSYDKYKQVQTISSSTENSVE